MKLKNKIILDKNKCCRYFKLGSYWILLFFLYSIFFDYITTTLEIFTLEKNIKFFFSFSLFIFSVWVIIFFGYFFYSIILDKFFFRKDWINLFTVEIPINKEILNEMDSKFKRNIVKTIDEGIKGKEMNSDFSERIIYSILKKELKKL